MNLGEETREQTRIVETSVGRALLWDIVPDGLSFDHRQPAHGQKAISQVINQCYRAVGLKSTVIFADH